MVAELFSSSFFFFFFFFFFKLGLTVTMLAWGCLGDLGFVLGCDGWLHGNCWDFCGFFFWWVGNTSAMA
jgi:hypothetical protein